MNMLSDTRFIHGVHNTSLIYFLDWIWRILLEIRNFVVAKFPPKFDVQADCNMNLEKIT